MVESTPAATKAVSPRSKEEADRHLLSACSADLGPVSDISACIPHCDCLNE
jgi:hypothetical protein